MSFWGRLFGTDAAIEKTIGVIGKVADEAFYTDEEEAGDRAAARRETQGMVIEWLRNTQGQNLSRRIIALSVTGIWLLMYLLSAGMALVAVWVGPETAGLMIDSSMLIDSRQDRMTGAVMLVLGFYFAAPKVGEIAEAALARFGNAPRQ